jgi:hypothetical protein
MTNDDYEKAEPNKRNRLDHPFAKESRRKRKTKPKRDRTMKLDDNSNVSENS